MVEYLNASESRYLVIVNTPTSRYSIPFSVCPPMILLGHHPFESGKIDVPAYAINPDESGTRT